MNENLLARATFVLDRRTFEQITYVADRMALSRSELVRHLLAEPVANMATLMGRIPEDPSPDELRQLALDGLEVVESTYEREIAPLRKIANG